jgi:hypothetical protein
MVDRIPSTIIAVKIPVTVCLGGLSPPLWMVLIKEILWLEEQEGDNGEEIIHFPSFLYYISFLILGQFISGHTGLKL